MFQTINANVSVPEPQETVGKTADEIGQIIWDTGRVSDEEREIVHRDITALKRIMDQRPVQFYLSEVRRAIYDPEDYKEDFVAIAPVIRDDWIVAVARFDHGDNPEIVGDTVIGHGYQCW